MSAVNTFDRRQFLSVATLAATSMPWGLLRSAALKLPTEGDLPSLHGATGWINSAPLSTGDLRGRVVLIDFWTYSCINWRRTLPYVRAWAMKYRDHGLVVVGVHSPEFLFERNIDNVRVASQSMMIEYPIAIDNDYAIWKAFGNEFWPALYLVDTKGQIRHHAFGEGEYDKSERVIQELVKDAGAPSFDPGLAPVDASGPEVAADWQDLRSNESYLGADRTEGFASPGGIRGNRSHTYTLPEELNLNHWALEGDWSVFAQLIRPARSGSRIAYRFHARDLHLVMGPASPGTAIRFRVLLDGQPPMAAHGSDVDALGYGVIEGPRLYQLIRQNEPIVDRRFDIEFFDAGIEAYSFTFG
ncbi:MAG TPA: thioredoxin family protein [Terracidiphilus sp.]|jgi:thiol-disulfide isomerase/thioredoxin